MPQLIAAAALGAVLYAGARWVKGWIGELQLAAREAEQQRQNEAARTRDLGTLVLDPESGEYRPKAG